MRTPGWGRFAGHFVAREPVRGVVVSAELLVWVEHWSNGQPRLHTPRGCPWCMERSKLRRRCAFALRRQGWYGWSLVEGGQRLQDRFYEALGREACYGAQVELWRDGKAPNASLRVRMLGRASWSNPARDPIRWAEMAAHVPVLVMGG